MDKSMKILKERIQRIENGVASPTAALSDKFERQILQTCMENYRASGVSLVHSLLSYFRTDSDGVVPGFGDRILCEGC